MPINVAIVEDDTRLRESLTVLLNGTSEFRCLGAFSTGEEALKELPRRWPDVVLMDINMPGMSGIECVAKLKELRPTLQVIMLTVYLDDEKIFQSLMRGASGYLIKKTPLAKIMEAIVDVQSGGSPMSNTIARRVVQHFQEKKPANETEGLTSRELEILTHLAKGYQYKEIADLLTISVKTVRNHLQNIYAKLHVRSRTEAVVKFLNRAS